MLKGKVAGVAVWGLLAVCLAVPADLSAQNLLVNPGFEKPDASGGDQAGITGWNEFGEPYTRYVSRSVEPHSGLQVLKMFGPWVQWQGTGVTQSFPAVEGDVWIAEVWSYNSIADPMGSGNICFMKIEFLDDAMGPVGGEWLAGINVYEVVVADENSPLNEWQQFGLGTAPAPAGTAYANYVLVEVQGGVNGASPGSAYLDDASFRLEVEPDPCDIHDPVFDVDDNGLVDVLDYMAFEDCATGPAVPLPGDATLECTCMDRDADLDIDQGDFGVFQRCFTGAGGMVDPTCDDVE